MCCTIPWANLPLSPHFVTSYQLRWSITVQWTHVPTTITTKNNLSEISDKWDLRYPYGNPVNYLEFLFINFNLLPFWTPVTCLCLRGETKTTPKVSHSGTESPQTAETSSSSGQRHSFWNYSRNTSTLHPGHPNCHTTLPLCSGTRTGSAAGSLLLHSESRPPLKSKSRKAK